jgi:hypothetical protein
MKGVHIQPTSAIEEIRLSIQNNERLESNQVKTTRSGMLFLKLFFPQELA